MHVGSIYIDIGYAACFMTIVTSTMHSTVL